MQLSDKIKSLIENNEIIKALNLTGEANILFSIDDKETIHVESVVTNDYLGEYHIRQTLEGLKLDAGDSLIGKTFAFAVNFVQSK